MAPLRRLVIDVLKPHEPPLTEFSDHLAETETVEGVTVSLIELDQEVQNTKLTLEGADLTFSAVEDTIERLGATIHSVDQVTSGDMVVEDRPTLQDR